MRRSNIQMLLTPLAVAASGCTSMGTGSGVVAQLVVPNGATIDANFPTA
jgi:hypothetical protein